MKKAYHYDPSLFVLTGEYEALPSPLEPDVYLLAAHSTFTAPPKTKEFEAAVFDGLTDKWSIIKDYRGQIYHHKKTGETVEIKELGDIPPELTNKPRPSNHHNWNDATQKWLADDETLAQVAKDESEAFALACAESVRVALQNAIDLKAQALGYKDGNSLMLYAGFDNPFQAQALVFSQWEALVWVEAMAYKELVLAGKKPMLAGDEAVLMMPDYSSEVMK